MDLATGKRNRIPVAQLIRRTLRQIEPHARELGSEAELEGISEILSRGNGADRQLRVFNANRDVVEVVREIADVDRGRGRSRGRLEPPARRRVEPERSPAGRTP